MGSIWGSDWTRTPQPGIRKNAQSHPQLISTHKPFLIPLFELIKSASALLRKHVGTVSGLSAPKESGRGRPLCCGASAGPLGGTWGPRCTLRVGAGARWCPSEPHSAASLRSTLGCIHHAPGSCPHRFYQPVPERGTRHLRLRAIIKQVGRDP